MVSREAMNLGVQSDDLSLILSADAPRAAPALLGWTIVARSPEGEAGGRIVETEAYMGALDPASHAFRGQTTRTAPMFAASGTVYAYLSYGIHICLNLVTGPVGTAQAVLIRAVEPTVGLDLMMRRRGIINTRRLADGPGKVGQALGLKLADSGARLGGNIQLRAPAEPPRTSDIGVATRIGLNVGTTLPWRFYLKANPHVSRAGLLVHKRK